jgi:hypothetical protein
MKSLLLLITVLFAFINAYSQTTIINSSNNTGTSGANGSFENATSTFAANSWTAVNGVTNMWFVGTQSFCVGTKGAYIGTASGNNNYTTTTSDVSHFYKDVTFPAGETCITLTFNWKGQGESGYDGLKIYLGSTAVTPIANTEFTTSDGSAVQIGSTFYNLQAACSSTSITISSSNAGTSKRLVFSWVNDNSVGTTPAATIDAISLVSQAPAAPSCSTIGTPANAASGISTCSTSLSWTGPTGCNSATSYDVYFGTSSTPPFVTNTTSTTYSPTVVFGTTYYWQIRPKNASGTASGCTVWSFTTGSSTNSEFNLVDDATATAPFTCTTLTTATNDQRGCAWDANTRLDFGTSFSYDFTINLGGSDAGADGLAFVMQNDPLGRCKCGTTGYQLGAGGILNSVIVEVDTYMNTQDRDDFTSSFIGCGGTEEPDHLDIWFNGNVDPDLDGDCNAIASGERPATATAVRLQTGGSNYNIENGADHKLRIAWNAGTSTLTASVYNNTLSSLYGTITSTFNPLTVFGTTTPFYGFTGSTGGLSNTQSFCSTITLLPIEGVEVSSNCENAVRNIVWTTVSEDENDYFTIEKTEDGIQFEELTKIESQGNSTVPTDYSWSDYTPSNAIVYYRLSLYDFNGVKHEVDIVSLECGQEITALEIQNVTLATTTINMEIATNFKGKHTILIYDLIGNVIVSKEVLLDKGKSKIELDKEVLSSSIYLVSILNENESKTQKVFIGN